MKKGLKQKELNTVSGGSKVGPTYWYRIVNSSTGSSTNWEGPYNSEDEAKIAGQNVCTNNETVETKKISGFENLYFEDCSLNL